MDFTSIQAAVNASVAGDRIDVRNDSYGPVTVDVGVTIMAKGDRAQILGLTIANVPPGEVLALTDFDCIRDLRLRDNQGAVILNSVPVVDGNLCIERSTDVRIAKIQRASLLLAIDSFVQTTDRYFQSGVYAGRKSFTASDCTLKGQWGGIGQVTGIGMCGTPPGGPGVVVAGLFVTEPLGRYAEAFTVHRVDVISNESGVDNDPAVDQIIALANSNKYGGAGYTTSDLATSSGGDNSALEIVKHELGHSFGNLADEYTYGGPSLWPGGEPSSTNLSTFDAPSMASQEIKWDEWLGTSMPGFEGKVGTYEGGGYSVTGIYRPSPDSLMRSLGRPFSLVGAEQVVKQIYRTVSPIDSSSDPAPRGSSRGGSGTSMAQE